MVQSDSASSINANLQVPNKIRREFQDAAPLDQQDPQAAASYGSFNLKE